MAEELQNVTGNTVELAYVDQGCTGEAAAPAAREHGIRLEVTQASHGQTGFVLLPRRCVIEQNFAWAARFRRLARDYERLDPRSKTFITCPSPHLCSPACSTCSVQRHNSLLPVRALARQQVLVREYSLVYALVNSSSRYGWGSR